ncbi:hypothetical protein AAKU55_000231 [Oxalobacteraceae bacterium GrIS 1.11]
MDNFLFRTLPLLLAGFSLLSDARAEDKESQKIVSVSGFGTLGALYNSTDQADFLRDVSQSKGAGHANHVDFGVDSVLGLQLDAKFNESLKGAVQVVSRRRYDASFSPEFSWAFVSYAPREDIELRAGRLGFDCYMLADSRNIGYSYQLVRPPVDYFGTLSISHIDGADMVLKYPLGDGIARVKMFAGTAREKSATPDDGYYDLTGSPVRGGYVDYQTSKWQYRLGYAQIRLRNELLPIMPLQQALRSPFLAALTPEAGKYADSLGLADKMVKYYSAGVVYDIGFLQAQLVLNHFSSASLSLQSSDAGYFSLAYRSGKWMPYFSYAAVKSKVGQQDTGLPSGLDPGIDALIGAAKQATLNSTNKQNTLSVGVRYDVLPNADIKFQVDRVHASSPFIWGNVQPGWNGRATLLSITVDFVF